MQITRDDDIIHKFRLPEKGKHSVWLPPGSVPLSVAWQHGAPVVWVHRALISEGSTAEFVFDVVQTGCPFPHRTEENPRKFVGTFMTPDGYQVGHVFCTRK